MSPASRSSRITTGTPPSTWRSCIMNRPAGRISAICGVLREILSMSARPNSIPASPARAGRCRQAFVEPPRAAATAIAFSNDVFVRIGRRTAIALERIDEHRGRAAHDLLARRVGGSRRRHTWNGQPECLGDARHRVRGVHARARALARQRHAFELGQVLEAHLPGRMRADRLVDVLDRRRPRHGSSRA